MKFLILDRDGTIIKDSGYVHKIEDLVFLPGAIEGLKKFRDAGYRFIIITNQAGIARGIYNEAQFILFDKELTAHLANKGIKIEKTYYCPHHPDFTGKCLCRKPNMALLQQAEQEFGLTPTNSMMIGDSDSDIELGKNYGCSTILIENENSHKLIQPHYKTNSILGAFDMLKEKGYL